MNRIAHARRYDRDRSSGPADWQLAVEQRYLYDASNQRTVKTTTFRGVESGAERTALYVYPGDFERRGLQTTLDRTSYEAISGDTETQYGVGGARIVWRTGTRDDGLDRDQRITISLTDLIQSTTEVIDLATGELVETGSYYANGARETYRSNESETVAPEPMGFTGKEADEEVGLTYFGHRYLMARLGRWASPDPLQTHAVGGGEAVNGYHYVAGNVLQARDPLGLSACSPAMTVPSQQAFMTTDVSSSFWGAMRVPRDWDVVGDTWVSQEGLLDVFERANRGDIVVFEGHGNQQVLVPNGWVFPELTTTGQLTDAIERDESAPSVVILGSCYSADGPMLDEFIASGVGVAFGWEGTVNAVIAKAVSARLAEELMAGSTIAEALEAGNTVLSELQNPLLQPTPVTLQVRVREGVRMDASLDDNGLGLPAPVLDDAAESPPAAPTPGSSEPETPEP